MINNNNKSYKIQYYVLTQISHGNYNSIIMYVLYLFHIRSEKILIQQILVFSLRILANYAIR